jgi:hypothetical protein
MYSSSNFTEAEMAFAICPAVASSILGQRTRGRTVSDIARVNLNSNKAIVLILRGHLQLAKDLMEQTMKSFGCCYPILNCLLYIYLRQGKVIEALSLIKNNRLCPMI